MQICFLNIKFAFVNCEHHIITDFFKAEEEYSVKVQTHAREYNTFLPCQMSSTTRDKKYMILNEELLII